MNKSGNKSATAKRRLARRRVWPLWIRPAAWSVLVAFVVGGAGGGAWWSGTRERLMRDIEHGFGVSFSQPRRRPRRR